MKKLLLAGVIALSVLTASVANAADTIPKQYRGYWCSPKHGEYLFRCRRALSEGDTYIGRDHLNLGEPDSEGEYCRVITVGFTWRKHAVGVVPKEHRLLVNCKGKESLIDLYLNPRTNRLTITGVDTQ